MTEAAANGDAKKVAALVRTLGGKSASYGTKTPTHAPSTDADGALKWGGGEIFGSPEELAAAWKEFAENKFKTTAREDARSDMPDLGPASTRCGNELTRRELEQGLKTLKLMKAPGMDGFPIEIYINVPEVFSKSHPPFPEKKPSKTSQAESSVVKYVLMTSRQA